MTKTNFLLLAQLSHYPQTRNAHHNAQWQSLKFRPTRLGKK
jgi:hypothetical protein